MIFKRNWEFACFLLFKNYYKIYAYLDRYYKTFFFFSPEALYYDSCSIMTIFRRIFDQRVKKTKLMQRCNTLVVFLLWLLFFMRSLCVAFFSATSTWRVFFPLKSTHCTSLFSFSYTGFSPCPEKVRAFYTSMRLLSKDL